MFSSSRVLLHPEEIEFDFTGALDEVLEIGSHGFRATEGIPDGVVGPEA